MNRTPGKNDTDDDSPSINDPAAIDRLHAELNALKIQNNELRELVNIDGLTGAFNHRCFQNHLEREFSKATRHKTPLSLLICDIDYFKAFNDTFGHQIGDSLLKHFSRNLDNNLRTHDILARYGGEEFVIILSETALEQAGLVAEKLRKKIIDTPYSEGGQAFNITASFGVATYIPEHHGALTAEKLIYQADLAMLRAKKKGRNRVECYVVDDKANRECVIKSTDFPKYSADSRLAPGTPERAKILIVDDEFINVQIMENILKDEYDLLVAMDAKALFESLKQEIPDLLLLDIMMPDIDGYEICRMLKKEPAYANIPIILVSGLTEIEDQVKAFSLGAFDYVNKPVPPAALKMRVKNCLKLQQQQNHLETMVHQRTAELQEAQHATIECMAAIAEYRDPDTGAHIQRCREFMRILIRELQKSSRYAALMTPEYTESLCLAAPLHDIGKVGIPDTILLKKGKLTAEEFNAMKHHTNFGFDAIRVAEARNGTELLFLKTVKEIAYGHHERWDGSGYPQGIKGDQIPLSARLMAIVDVYDALRSARCYKPAFSHQKAVEIIAESNGTHFDPELVQAFLAVNEEFDYVSGKMRD